MTLTDEQLEQIKIMIDTDKCRPIIAIETLFPNEDTKSIRNQLFEKYNNEELLIYKQRPEIKNK